MPIKNRFKRGLHGRVVICSGLLAMCLLCGCAVQKVDNKKLADLEYTVLAEEEVPEELKIDIEEAKEKKMGLTYRDAGWLYIASGYGRQDTGGFSIQIRKCYETKDSVVLDTKLIGPTEKEAVAGTTWPYLVIKMEDRDKTVLFQ